MAQQANKHLSLADKVLVKKCRTYWTEMSRLHTYVEQRQAVVGQSFSPQEGLALGPFFIFYFFLRELNVPGVRAPNLDGHPSWRRGEALRILNGSGRRRGCIFKT